MDAPWLTVALTTYNARDYLAAALQSIVAQGDPGVEVIAVDDGSTDETLAILESYQGRLDLKIVAREHTGNWIASMNCGLHMGRGRYACFLHHDDLWLPGRLREVRSVLERAPEAALLVHPSWFIDHAGARLNIWGCNLACGRELSRMAVVERLLVQNAIAVPAAIFRRDVALDVGGLDESNWHSADWDFWLKLAAAGTTVYLPQPLTGYRIHPIGATWQGTDRAASYRGQMESVLEQHFAAWEPHRPIRPVVRRTARFSMQANLFMAAYAHGHRPRLGSLAAAFLGLGPHGWYLYLRDSRVFDRVGGRLRAGIFRWSRPSGLRGPASEDEVSPGPEGRENLLVEEAL